MLYFDIIYFNVAVFFARAIAAEESLTSAIKCIPKEEPNPVY
jgi:hypothetical protein